MSHVDCNGNEMSLTQCPRRGGASCSHEDDAGVICESESTAKLTGSIRLEDGDIRTSGRVAIQYHGVWGTICRDGWNIWNARVVCRNLGYCGGSSVIHDHGAFGFGSGPIWLTEVKCNGSERRLDQCHHSGWGNNSCDHGYDVGVVCEICPTGTIRLEGRPDNSTGIVTISNNGIWGTICSANWSNHEARVVCRSLGFSGGTATDATNFTSQTGSIWLSGVVCTGMESDITKCYHDNYASVGWGSNNCRHYQDVAVRCFNEITSTTASGSTITYKTIGHTTRSPTTAVVRPSLAHGMDKTWIIIIVAVVAALITVTVVAIIYGVIKVKTSNSKNSLMLNARGQPNDYVINDDNEPGPCTTSLVRMPETKQGKARDSGVYEEIDEDDDCIAIRQPDHVSYRPATSESRRSKYKGKTAPLPELPEDIPAESSNSRKNTFRQPHLDESQYLEPRNVLR